MTQKIQTPSSCTCYEGDSINGIDDLTTVGTPLDEFIESAFARLQKILASKASAEAELENLFERRRRHAVLELEKAKRRLEFVDREEKRMKGLVLQECFSSVQNAEHPAPFLQENSVSFSLLPREPSLGFQEEMFALSGSRGKEDVNGGADMANSAEKGAKDHEVAKKEFEDVAQFQRARRGQELIDERRAASIRVTERKVVNVEEKERVRCYFKEDWAYLEAESKAEDARMHRKQKPREYSKYEDEERQCRLAVEEVERREREEDELIREWEENERREWEERKNEEMMRAEWEEWKNEEMMHEEWRCEAELMHEEGMRHAEWEYYYEDRMLEWWQRKYRTKGVSVMSIEMDPETSIAWNR